MNLQSEPSPGHDRLGDLYLGHSTSHHRPHWSLLEALQWPRAPTVWRLALPMIFDLWKARRHYVTNTQSGTQRISIPRSNRISGVPQQARFDSSCLCQVSSRFLIHKPHRCLFCFSVCSVSKQKCTSFVCFPRVFRLSIVSMKFCRLSSHILSHISARSV